MGPLGAPAPLCGPVLCSFALHKGGGLARTSCHSSMGSAVMTANDQSDLTGTGSHVTSASALGTSLYDLRHVRVTLGNTDVPPIE